MTAAFRKRKKQSRLVDWPAAQPSSREKHPITESAAVRWDLEALPAVSSDVLPNLPDGWIYRRLGHISVRVSVGHVGPTSQYYCRDKSGIPFIRSQNVRPGRLEMNDVAHIIPEFHNGLKKSQLRSGDLLIVRVGANRGDACVVPDDIHALNCANIVFARPFKGIPSYLEVYCQSALGQKLLLEMTTGSAQGVLNTTAIAELPIPIPPVAEQAEIELRLAAIIAQAEVIESRVSAVGTIADRLAQSVLAKAFHGELVPTEAELARREGRHYEPASVLLERIKREREMKATASPKQSRKRQQRRISSGRSAGTIA